jgi:hypothetical protein
MSSNLIALNKQKSKALAFADFFSLRKKKEKSDKFTFF